MLQSFILMVIRGGKRNTPRKKAGMADQQFNVCVLALGGVQVVVVHVDAASCSTTEMQARLLKLHSTG